MNRWKKAEIEKNEEVLRRLGWLREYFSLRGIKKLESALQEEQGYLRDHIKQLKEFK